MNIVIDARMIGWPGVGRYTKNLLLELESIDSKNSYMVLMKKSDSRLWNPSSTNFKKIGCNIEPYSLGEQVALPWILYKLRPDLVHFTTPNIPILYFEQCVTTIHDTTLLSFKNIRGNKIAYQIKFWAFKFVMKIAATRPRIVITDTNYVRKEIISKYGRSLKNTEAVYLGFGTNGSKAKKMKLPTPFILCAGSYYPHKNLPRLVEAFSRLHIEHPEFNLYFAGKPDFFSKELQLQIERLNLNQNVKLLGFVSDEELAWLYQNASLYVFPSLSEGFGLPGLEAMSYGTPVASSNATCLPEVYGDAAVYFDPNSVNDMARVISSTLYDKKLLAKLRLAGQEHVKKFSWKRMAEQTLEVYEKALKR